MYVCMYVCVCVCVYIYIVSTIFKRCILRSAIFFFLMYGLILDVMLSRRNLSAFRRTFPPPLSSSVLLMEAAIYSEISVNFHHNKRCPIPEDVTLVIAFLERLVKSWLGVVLFTLSYISRLILTHITII